MRLMKIMKKKNYIFQKIKKFCLYLTFNYKTRFNSKFHSHNNLKLNYKFKTNNNNLKKVLKNIHKTTYNQF